MISYYFRPILAVLMLIISITIHFFYGFSNAWFLYLTGIILMAIVAFFGNAIPAFNSIRKGKIKVAQKFISTTLFPKILLSNHKAYFFITKGLIDMQFKDYDQAKDHLLTALNHKIKHPTDKALTALNLAHISFLEKNSEATQNYLDLAKSCNSTDLILKEKISELDKLV